MATWKDEEIRALLSVRADLGIVHQLHGTARDAVVYEQIARRLQDRGIERTKMQVITKLKSLKKTYMSLVDESRPGVPREWWSYFQMCEEVWGENRATKTEPATVAICAVSSAITDISGDSSAIPVMSAESRLGSEVKSEPEHPETPVCVRPATPVFSAESPVPFSGVDTCSSEPKEKEPRNQEDGGMSEPGMSQSCRRRQCLSFGSPPKRIEEHQPSASSTVDVVVLGSSGTVYTFTVPHAQNMHNWQDHEIRELLRIRAHEQFRGQITGTVKDAVVFSTIARLLAQQGVHRSRDQVVSKLKNLKKQYRNYKEQISAKGGDRSAAYWPFFEEAERAFGDRPLPAEPPDSLAPTTERLESAPVPASAPVRNQGAAFDQDEAEQVVVGNWGEQSQGPTPNQGTKREQAPVEEDEDEEYGSPEEPVQSTCGIPTKKRKTTILHQVNSMINATMSKLREMDAAMQAQEDARLKRLMDHEKDMQKSLIQEMLTLHRTISAENHQRHLELVDRVMSRVPLPSSHSGL